MSPQLRGSVGPDEPFSGTCDVPGFDLRLDWMAGRELTAEQREQIGALLHICFNGSPAGSDLGVPIADHLQWKFGDYPLGSTVILTVEFDGRVIGFNGRNRRRWLLGGVPFIGSFGHDFCRLPEWQGRGLGRATAPCGARAQHPADDFQIGEGTHPADRHLALARGLTPLANEVHDYVRPIRPRFRVGQLVSRLAPWTSSRREPAGATPASNTAAVIRTQERSRRSRFLQTIRNLQRFAASLAARRRAAHDDRWEINTLSRFDDRHEQLIAGALRQFDFVGERPIDYLNWRFCDPRGGSFHVRVAEEDGEPLGYAVTRTRPDRAYIADVLALPGRNDVAESLIRDAVLLAERAGSPAIGIRLPERHPYRNALGRTGFFDVGRIAGELIGPIDPDDPAHAPLVHEDARVHYVFADADWT